MQYYYEYEVPPLKKPKYDVEATEEKSNFIILIKYGTDSDKSFANILEGYKIPYSYDEIEGIDNEKISEYTFTKDFHDVIKVIIDMRSINIINIYLK